MRPPAGALFMSPPLRPLYTSAVSPGSTSGQFSGTPQGRGLRKCPHMFLHVDIYGHTFVQMVETLRAG